MKPRARVTDAENASGTESGDLAILDEDATVTIDDLDPVAPPGALIRKLPYRDVVRVDRDATGDVEILEDGSIAG